MKKLISAILILTMTALALTACFNSEVGPDTTAQTSRQAETSAEVKIDNLPNDLNYNDAEVNILHWSNTLNNEFGLEDQGASIDAAIVRKDAMVEQRLGVSINYVGIERTAMLTHLETLSNRGGVDIIANHSMNMGEIAAAGQLFDLNEVQYLDFNQPYWPKSLVRDATIKGSMYFCTGDISNNVLLGMEAMFYNKKLTETNLYELVNSKQWTIDKMLEITDTLYANIDGIAGKTAGDRFGFASYSGMVNALAVGMGVRIVEVATEGRNEGEYIYSPKYRDVDKITDILKTLNDAFWLSDSWIYCGSFDDSAKIFTDGRTLFYEASVRLTLNTLPNTGITYGVLPTPMYDSEQDGYHTLMANTYSLYGIYKAAADPDMCGAVIECLASEGYSIVTPVVFEQALKARYSDSGDDSVMFDIIRNGTVIEIGLIYSNILSKIPSIGLFTMVDVQKTDWASFLEDRQTAIELNIEALNSNFK